MTEYYVIATERDGITVPFFLETVWTPDLPIFSLPEAPIATSSFKSHYSLVAKIKELDVDILLNDYIASTDFLKLCNSVSANYFSVPVQIHLKEKKSPQKEFSFFCVTDRHSILDNSKSSYKLADPRLSVTHTYPVYERIDRFVVKSGFAGQLFFCEELKKIVCSARFKKEFESRRLTGAQFTPIDDSYVFAPWDDF